jgi:uncharacterized membrane protein YhfC
MIESDRNSSIGNITAAIAALASSVYVLVDGLVFRSDTTEMTLPRMTFWMTSPITASLLVALSFAAIVLAFKCVKKRKAAWMAVSYALSAFCILCLPVYLFSLSLYTESLNAGMDEL